MSHKFGELSCLTLQSRIRNPEPSPQTYARVPKHLGQNHQNHCTNQGSPPSTSSPTPKKNSEPKTQPDETNSNHSSFNNSGPGSLSRVKSFENMPIKAVTELGRVREEKQILKRNFNHELEFHIRERMKDLVIVQELVASNQYQRLLKYVETELAILRKKHYNVSINEDLWLSVLSRQTIIKSSIEEDLTFRELVSNVVVNVSEYDRKSQHTHPQLRNLTQETELTIRKLSSYLQHSPFEIRSPIQCNSLAFKMISEHGLKHGEQIIKYIGKAVLESTKGRYNLEWMLGDRNMKSQMSKLIQQNSISKIRNRKKSNM